MPSILSILTRCPLILSWPAFDSSGKPTFLSDDLYFSTIRILVKPLSVRIVTKPRVLRADQQYEIICETFGSRPRPVFEWWQDGRKIKPTKNTG
ncbi:hypothetical protein J437_LFUL012501 [Ladona fulva]|uniref:Ig-like domain-containing protein n=1 Tax=Ladona fulva TaxID=123851 RepID=A0A8K0KDU5_LADFU|nr:hypothetical protein J437_LFUL012501 [Ladona fulva]